MAPAVRVMAAAITTITDSVTTEIDDGAVVRPTGEASMSQRGNRSSAPRYKRGDHEYHCEPTDAGVPQRYCQRGNTGDHSHRRQERQRGQGQPHDGVRFTQRQARPKAIAQARAHQQHRRTGQRRTDRRQQPCPPRHRTRQHGFADTGLLVTVQAHNHADHVRCRRRRQELRHRGVQAVGIRVPKGPVPVARYRWRRPAVTSTSTRTPPRRSAVRLPSPGSGRDG